MSDTIDSSDILVSSMISDTRIESSYEVLGVDGRLSTVSLVDYPTVDDLIIHGMKNIAAEIKFGVDYESVQNRGVVTQLVRVHLPTERS